MLKKDATCTPPKTLKKTRSFRSATAPPAPTKVVWNFDKVRVDELREEQRKLRPDNNPSMYTSALLKTVSHGAIDPFKTIKTIENCADTQIPYRRNSM